jgi:hypothetical protein
VTEFSDSRRILSSLRERVRRVGLRGVPRPLAAVIVALWAAWAAIAVALLVPGAIGRFSSDVPTRDGPFLVVWCVLLGTTALVGAAGVVLVLLRAGRGGGLAAAALAFVVAIVPVPLLLNAMAFQPALLSLLAAVASAVLALVAGARFPSPGRSALIAATALVTALAWVPLLTDGIASEVPLSLLSTYSILGTSAVAVTGFVTIGGVASAAETANTTAGSLAHRTLTPLATGLVLAAVVAVLVLRFTVLRDVFGELESGLWSLRTVSSWPHAVLLGLLITFLAARSVASPFRSRGQKPVIAVVSLAAGLSNLVLVAAAIMLFVVLAFTGSIIDPTPYLGYINAAGLAVVLTLLLFALHPRYAHSTGRVGAIVALAYLVPMLSGLVFQLRDSALPVFWASPTQVVVVVVALACGLFVAGLLRRRPVVETAMLLRLAVIPVVAIHAGEILPAVWADALSRPFVIALSLGAFLFLSPQRTADARRSTRSLVAASALQLAILGTFATSIVVDYNAEVFTVVAVIWLAIPVSAVLCCRVTRENDAPLAHPESPGPRSAATDHDLADAPPRLDDAVGFAERTGVERRQGAREGAAQGT